MKKATIKIDPQLVPAVQAMQAALDRVAEMEIGGDLESLIEEEIERIAKEFYPQALGRRERSLGEQAGDFPPSGMPEVRR